jgi:hypothetical protein
MVAYLLDGESLASELEEMQNQSFESWQVMCDGNAFTQGFREAIRRVLELLPAEEARPW